MRLANGAVLAVGLFMLTLIVGLANAQTSKPTHILQIGILPTLSARVLLTNYLPIKLYLQRVLHRSVELTTAPDFKTFYFNTLEGKYDLVVTAAHLAQLAQNEAKYVPLVTYKAVNGAVLVEAKDQPLHTIQDLKGKILAFGDRNSLIVMQTINYLQEQGLRAGVDYTLQATSGHSSALYSVQNHASKLAVTSAGGYKNLPDAIKGRLAIFTTLSPMPGLIWLAHPRMAADIPRIKAALLAFTPEMKEGKQFYDATSYLGLREVNSAEKKTLEPYVQDVSKGLNKGK